MYVLEDCRPQNVFRYFEEISRIPRGSGNEKAVSDYILGFALNLGLKAVQDESFNLVIKKEGTSGYENAPVVIIQGHMDMVCEKNRETVHDFLKDPLKLYIEDDFIKAEGTTLGGDNGIAVAYAMALLEAADIPHPPLEIVLTTDEEAGMNGAAAIAPELLSGKILINIDSEEEGIFLSSCAGGLKASLKVSADFCRPPSGFEPLMIFVSGLKGGHSGMDIIKERGNSNRIMGRVLNILSQKFDIYLEGINGGSKDNAIPREAEAVVWVNKSDNNNFDASIKEIEKSIRHEYRTSDEGLKISAETADKTCGAVFDKLMLKKVISALLLTPDGIQDMSVEIEGLVETSNNLGVVRTSDNEIVFTSAIRSSVISRKYALLDQIKILADLLTGTVETRGNYPAWEYNPDSEIRKIFINTYKDMYGKDAETAAVHAGLECGLFAEKVKGMDMISFGPDIFDVHTPDERMSISSVKRTWEFLLTVLSKINGLSL